MRVGSRLQKLGVTVLGVIVALVLLELALRVGGWAFMQRQDARNRAATEGGEGRVVLCVGESTTAFGGEDSYPRQLEVVLEERDPGQGYSVINEGIPGTDSSVIVSQLENNLDRYRPGIVVAMMGANDTDRGAIPYLEEPRAEQTGVVESLRIVRLARQLMHASPEAEGGAASGPTIPDGGYLGLVEQGRQLVVAYRYAEAEHVFQRARELDPNQDLAYVELGMMYETLARYDEAEQMFLRGTEICPRCVGALVELARHYERQEDNERAAATFRQALAIRSDSAKAWFGLGRVLRKLEAYDDGAEAFRRVLRLDPENSDANVSLGLCLEGAGDLEAAEEALQRGWTRSRDRRSFIRLADYYERQQQHEAMASLIEQGVAANPDDDDILGRVALYHRRQGDTERAVMYLSAADEARRRATPTMMRGNYHLMKELLDRRGVPLVAVQYPVRSVGSLEAIFAGMDGVVFVDNEATFREALAERPYEELFWDNCYGDFGHCTRDGNRLLAESIATVILEQVPREVEP
jgi:tetratricopeptide (TPR) repeat protein